MPGDILERLQMDPGHRTIGEITQERAAAVHEIRALRGEINKIRGARNRGDGFSAGAPESAEDRAAVPRQLLLRLTDLCAQLAVSRGTIYRWLNEGKFPRPVRIGNRSVRWRAADIEEWINGLDA